MSLQARLAALVAAVGADIKALQAAGSGAPQVAQGSATLAQGQTLTVTHAADAARRRLLSLVKTVVLPGSPGGNLIPVMSSNTAPAGSASASSMLAAGYEPYQAMDGSVTTFYSSATGTLPEWIGYSFAAPVSVSAYTLGRRMVSASDVYGAAYFPVAWRLQYSADGAAWVDADVQSGVSFESPSRVFQRSFTLAAPISARHWRLYCTAHGGANYLQLHKFELAGGGTGDTTVQRLAALADYEIALDETQTSITRTATGSETVSATVWLP